MARVFRPQAISFSGLGSNFRRQRMVRAPEYAVRGRRWMDCIAAWEAASDRAGRESTYSSPRTSSSGLVRPALMSSIASCQRGSSFPAFASASVWRSQASSKSTSARRSRNSDFSRSGNFLTASMISPTVLTRRILTEMSPMRSRRKGSKKKEEWSARGARPASAEATARQAWKAK